MSNLPTNPEPTPPPPPDIDAAFAEFLMQHKVQVQIVLPNLFLQGAQELVERLGIADLNLKEGPKIVFQPMQKMSKE